MVAVIVWRIMRGKERQTGENAHHVVRRPIQKLTSVYTEQHEGSKK